MIEDKTHGKLFLVEYEITRESGINIFFFIRRRWDVGFGRSIAFNVTSAFLQVSEDLVSHNNEIILIN